MKKLGIIILSFILFNKVQAHDLRIVDKDKKPRESAQSSKSGNFIISFSNQSKGSEVSIYDIHGNHVVKNISLSEELQEINLSNHPKGIYFVEIVNGNKKCISKVVIQ